MGQNSDGFFSDFWISGQSPINCHNSRTSDDTDVKTGPVTKPDKRNKITSKKFDDDAMLENCDVMIIFPIYGQFWAIPNPESECTVCKTYILISSNLFALQKLKTELKNL